LYEEGSRIVVSLTSIILVCVVYAQVIKIFKTKSAKDFSLVLILALFFDGIAWLNYGVMLWEWPILVISCVSFPAVVGTAFGYFKYGFRR